eukprot:TRINITY_DN572_c0_g1_i12.p1 TRINITY_DN572_c0_g1~~TRINITY_DN572_c0_g1_i12.p1  ORF type:complete len:206 (-),score=27.60 TRINITY_DN572_c0_g1_i12:226-843(-)
MTTKCGRIYSEYLHKFYKTYQKLMEKGEDYARNNPPKNCPSEKWKALIDGKRKDEKFLARSKINVENRKKLKTNHTCGSRSLPISAIIAAEANEGELDFVEFYKQTHYSKKKNDFVTLGNQELYENLAKAQSEYCSQPDAIPLTGEELSIMVLKPRSGYIKGLGLRPSSSRGSFTMSSRAHVDHVKQLESELANVKQQSESFESK